MIYALPIAFLFGALGRRIAGGVLNQWFAEKGERVFGDYPARAIFGATIYLSALLGGWPFFPALVLIPAVFLGCAVGHYNSIDLGRGEGTFVRDFFVLIFHGLAGVALPAFVAWGFGFVWFPFIIAGVLISPLYELGYRVIDRVGPGRFPIGFRFGTEIGESLWGGFFGVAALLSAVL